MQDKEQDSQGEGANMAMVNHGTPSENVVSCSGGDTSYERTPSSKMNAAHAWRENFSLVGRKMEMNELLNYLTTARIGGLHVVSVWGIAGVGKSVLVKNLYYSRMIHNDKLFDRYGWVDVSHPFSLRDFSRSLLLELYSDTHQAIGTKDPIQECRKLLKEHRCLIVIDDLQSMEEWDMVRPVLVPEGSKSIITVITTEASFATHCADKKELVCNVKGLEVDAANELFQIEIQREHPFSPLKDSKDALLQELVLKCGGLPKLIAAMAAFLAPKTVNAMNIATSTNSKFMFELESSPEFESLRGLFSWMHSYFRTCPDFLKPCIFYLPIFPLNHSIRRRRLVRRWIAEGYCWDNDNSSAEERGEESFSGLLDLSIIQQPPHSIATASCDRRMVLCQVNSFIREYIISRRMEENLVFELGGSCPITTQRAGRHLTIREDWDRDRIVFESIEFSRLRSLTVFGRWESFFVSESMRVLRVLDLENALGVTDKDLEQMLKLLPRLKLLSLRGCGGICCLPSSLGDLRQLETLDVRHTTIVSLPTTITNLKKMQYVRAGATLSTREQSSPQFSEFCGKHRKLDGVQVTAGIGKLTALHTLGDVNASAAGGKAMLKDLRKLTQLRKLGVSGINRKNSKDFCSAISGHVHLESLSVRLSHDNQDCFNAFFTDLPPPKNLQSLKLYGLADKLPVWINQLQMLRKLDLAMNKIAQEAIIALKDLEVCILRLSAKHESKIDFRVMLNGQELRCYKKVKVLEISCNSSLAVTFGSRAIQNVELLKICCCGESDGSPLQLSGLGKLCQLKEVYLKGSHDDTLMQNLKSELAEHPNIPVLKLE